MFSTLVYAVGALAVGALSGMAYGNLGKWQVLLDPPTPAETQVSIAEPVANAALPSVKSESNDSARSVVQRGTASRCHRPDGLSDR
jgi:hypothetical protein